MTEPDAPGFFVTGGTLPPDAASYVERAADEELYSSLLAGGLCYVLDTRQKGKSSLMVRTARRLRRTGRRVAVLDLTAVGQNLSPEQWYFGLLDLAAAQAGEAEDALYAFWKAHGELGPMQRFVGALRSALLEPEGAGGGRGLVVFVDEIDAVRSLPFSADELFAGIRECHNRRASDPALARLTFCLLGVATPGDLIRDARVSPFNVGRRVELRDFTPEEAEPLAEGLRPYAGEAGARTMLARVLHWTGGHPYMTQRLCRAVAERLAEQKAREGGGGGRDDIEDEALVDIACRELFLTKAARETDDNLMFARNRLLNGGEDRAALLDLYGRVRAGKRVADDETNPLCGALRLSGVVTAGGGRLRVRNEVYARAFDAAWVAEHMPDAEVRRQKRAYRLGLLRAALAGSTALIVVGTLAALAWKANGRAQIAARRSRELEGRTSRLLYASRMNLLQRAYDDGDISRARDLLAETEPFAFKGFEWGYWRRLLRRETLSLPVSGPQSLVVWSRGGDWIATQELSTFHTPELRLWDAATGRPLRALSGRTEMLVGVPSPVSETCVALVDAPHGEAGAVGLFDPRTGERTHALPVRAVEATLSGDGKRVFTLERDRDVRTRVKVWDAVRGTLLSSTSVEGNQTLGALQNYATVQSTRDSRLLAFGSATALPNTAVTLLDTATGKRVWTPGGKVTRYGLSPTGRFLVATDGPFDNFGAFHVWDLRTHRRLSTLQVKRSDTYLLSEGGKGGLITSVRFSPDERLVVGAGTSGSSTDGRMNAKIWLWDRATGQERIALLGHRAVACGAEFFPDGRRLFSQAADNSLRIWDMATRQTLGVYSYGLVPPALSPGGDRFLTADTRAVLVCPVETGPVQPVTLFKKRSGAFFHTDGRHLIMFSANETALIQQHHTPVRCITLDLQTGRLQSPFTFTTNNYGINQFGAKYLLYVRKDAGKGTAVVVRDPLTGKQIRELRYPGLVSYMGPSQWPGLAVVWEEPASPFSARPMGQVGKGRVRVDVWDVSTGKRVLRLPEAGYTPVQAAPMNSMQNLWVTDTEGTVHFWSLRPLRELSQVSAGVMAYHPAASASISPDGRFLQFPASNSFIAGNLNVYDMATGRRVARNDHAGLGQAAIAFSGDGRYRLWADVQQNAHIMEGATDRKVQTLNSLGGGWLFGAAFSPDGSRVITSVSGGAAKLWDVETGAELMSLPKPIGNVAGTQFSPDGTRILSMFGSKEGTGVYLWDSNPVAPRYDTSPR